MMKVISLTVCLAVFTFTVYGQMNVHDGKYDRLLKFEPAFRSLKSPVIRKSSHQSVVLSRVNHREVDLSKQPFFCRIEDEIARSAKVNVKFRLGSVPYVDALEGKGYFEAVGYSRATNFFMSRKQ